MYIIICTVHVRRLVRSLGGKLDLGSDQVNNCQIQQQLITLSDRATNIVMYWVYSFPILLQMYSQILQLFSYLGYAVFTRHFETIAVKGMLEIFHLLETT